MRAADVMTRDVISATPDTPVRDLARRLLEHGISAVPVLDAEGQPIGMVSEGDLVSHEALSRAGGRDWWLKLVADAAEPSPELLAELGAPDRTAADVMHAPVITVSENTDLAEVARLLAQHHIKRVPVVTDHRVVGIVSRADLLGAVAELETHTAPPAPKKRHNFLMDMFGEYHRPDWEVIPVPEAKPADSPSSGINAKAFRGLVEDFQSQQSRQHDDARAAAAEQRRKLAAALIDTHLTDETWRGLLQQARQSAEAGAAESLLLRFPNELCTDGGRAIDVGEERWPATLRGEAAEIYLRWERELKPRGFRLRALVMEYPEGKPGDIGLFLHWGE